MAAAHIAYGKKVQIPRLKKETDDEVSIGSVRVMVWQGCMALLLAGLLQLLLALGEIGLPGIAAYIPIALVSVNLLTFLIVSAAKHRKLIATSVPQLLIFVIILALQVFALS